jgi:hypothetical protein
MLDIICTEAIEHGGLQEIPDQQHGGHTSFHEEKRGARTTEENNIGRSATASAGIPYDLRLVREPDGTLTWED